MRHKATKYEKDKCVSNLKPTFSLKITRNGIYEGQIPNFICKSPNSLDEMHLHGIILVVFIILDWIFVLMNATAMIPAGASHGENWPLEKLDSYSRV